MCAVCPINQPNSKRARIDSVWERSVLEFFSFWTPSELGNHVYCTLFYSFWTRFYRDLSELGLVEVFPNSLFPSSKKLDENATLNSRLFPEIFKIYFINKSCYSIWFGLLPTVLLTAPIMSKPASYIQIVV